ncbi:MAG: hypothetical protein KAV87_21905, partial [Desulfobacteraceae bacterium]|nr:hypothetical protein [Desulfobacteraceae bacterium]
ILMEKGDVKTFRESITFLIENDSKRLSMGARARGLVNKRFAWDKNAEALSKVFDEIIEGN